MEIVGTALNDINWNNAYLVSKKHNSIITTPLHRSMGRSHMSEDIEDIGRELVRDHDIADAFIERNYDISALFVNHLYFNKNSPSLGRIHLTPDITVTDIPDAMLYIHTEWHHDRYIHFLVAKSNSKTDRVCVSLYRPITQQHQIVYNLMCVINPHERTKPLKTIDHMYQLCDFPPDILRLVDGIEVEKDNVKLSNYLSVVCVPVNKESQGIIKRIENFRPKNSHINVYYDHIDMNTFLTIAITSCSDTTLEQYEDLKDFMDETYNIIKLIIGGKVSHFITNM